MARAATVAPATVIVLLALIFTVIVNYSDSINLSDGDRLIFGAIGISGFMIAVLTTQESNGSFVL